ncbi:MAG: helix-turn-helix domain-containing protein [Chloroflexi bacterium]|nr:helix-turn-helix domain-containing protein [Chloroflexota bacterium]
MSNKESMGLGEILKEARQRQGLSLDEVSEATKIRLSYLEAIEAEDYDRLPAPVYVRGFLRSYALFLGLDPERIQGLHFETTQRDTIWEPLPVTVSSSFPLGSWLVIAGALCFMIVSGFFLYWWGGGALLGSEGTGTEGAVEVWPTPLASIFFPNSAETIGPAPGPLGGGREILKPPETPTATATPIPAPTPKVEPTPTPTPTPTIHTPVPSSTPTPTPITTPRPTTVSVPNVKGLPLEDAKRVLVEAGLRVSPWINYQGHDTIPAAMLEWVAVGSVLSSTPEPGIAVAPGSEVSLSVRKD